MNFEKLFSLLTFVGYAREKQTEKKQQRARERYLHLFTTLMPMSKNNEW